MSAEYSVEEVRAQAMYEKGKLRLQTMLFDLANRIKADECAVPVAEVVAGYSIKWLGPDFACSLVVGTKLFTHPPAQVAQVDDKVVVIRDGRATTEGLVLAAAIYMGAVKDIFALRFDGPPYNERKVTRDDAALRAFDHLDAATKALRSAISHFVPIVESVAHAGADGGVGIDCVSHSPDAADSGRVVSEPRFFIDHTMIHDRVTGKHVTCDPDFRDYEINPGETTRINNPDGISNTCALLNGLAALATQPRAVPDFDDAWASIDTDFPPSLDVKRGWDLAIQQLFAAAPQPGESHE